MIKQSVSTSDSAASENRRSFLKFSLATLATLGWGCSRKPSAGNVGLSPAILRLDWVVIGKHAPYYLGRELGYYSSAGLALEIQGGKGSGNTAQLVAAGSHAFGYLDAGVLIHSIQEGAPLTAILAIKQKTPCCIVALKKTGIHTPKDLEGKSLAATAGVAEPILKLLPAVMRKNGADFSKVKVVEVAGQAKEGLMLAGKVDAMTGLLTAQPPVFESQGHEIDVLSYSDWGINPMSFVMVAAEKTLRERPELCRGFVGATIRSLQAAQQRPEEAVAALMKAYPEMDAQVALLQLKWLLRLISVPETEGHGIGYQSRKKWEELQALHLQYLELKENWDVGRYFTNEFLPQS